MRISGILDQKVPPKRDRNGGLLHFILPHESKYFVTDRSYIGYNMGDEEFFHRREEKGLSLIYYPTIVAKVGGKWMSEDGNKAVE